MTNPRVHGDGRSLRSLGRSLLVLFACSWGVLNGLEAALPLERYIADLDELAGAVRTALKTPDLEARNRIREDLARRLPESWHVDLGESRMVVKSGAIDGILTAIEKTPEGDARWWSLMVLLETMAGEGRAAMTGPLENQGAARRLEAILSRREFAGIREPGPIGRWVERIVAWIGEVLDRLGGVRLSRAPMQIVGWALLVSLLIIAMVWVLRAARGAALQSLGAVAPESPPRRDWVAWSADAAAAARQGRYRDAVRCAYWAGIQKLAGDGLWDLRRERTHREYLRALPAGHPLAPDLSALTRSFEWIWYGQRPATEEELMRVLAHLRCTGVAIAWPPPTDAS